MISRPFCLAVLISNLIFRFILSNLIYFFSFLNKAITIEPVNINCIINTKLQRKRYKKGISVLLTKEKPTGTASKLKTIASTLHNILLFFVICFPSLSDFHAQLVKCFFCFFKSLTIQCPDTITIHRYIPKNLFAFLCGTGHAKVTICAYYLNIGYPIFFDEIHKLVFENDTF